MVKLNNVYPLLYFVWSSMMLLNLFLNDYCSYIIETNSFVLCPIKRAIHHFECTTFCITSQKHMIFYGSTFIFMKVIEWKDGKANLWHKHLKTLFGKYVLFSRIHYVLFDQLLGRVTQRAAKMSNSVSRILECIFDLFSSSIFQNILNMKIS